MTSKKLKHNHIHAPCIDEKKKPIGRELAAMGLGALGLAAASCSREKPLTISIPVKKTKLMIVENEDGTETVMGLRESMGPLRQQDIEISAFDIAQVAVILLLMRYSKVELPENDKKQE